ncbi:MAG TPA: hypothetical protein VGR47_00605 [Terracidiphilus sp.]|nr:hypothetical protein [Terracidiphilus sp.]
MSKYDPLYNFLCAEASKGAHNVPLSFEQMEVILGFFLPDTASRRSQWWGNERGSSRHVQQNAWINAGYETRNVDLQKKTVEFIST